ncbi:MAG TPA: hypothetical protein VNS09_26745 [Solirubrobacter sp.]|nr:hypothetical protein [Solirubrobacter sp.]
MLLAHIAGVPVEETLLGLAPAAGALGLALRSLGARRIRALPWRRPALRARRPRRGR